MYETLLGIIVEQDMPLQAVSVADVVTAVQQEGGETRIAVHCLRLLVRI